MRFHCSASRYSNRRVNSKSECLPTILDQSYFPILQKDAIMIKKAYFISVAKYLTRFDIIPMYSDVLIPIRAAVFVPKT